MGRGQTSLPLLSPTGRLHFAVNGVAKSLEKSISRPDIDTAARFHLFKYFSWPADTKGSKCAKSDTEA